MEKPFYKKWWFILIAALVVIYGLSALTLLSNDGESNAESWITVSDKKETKDKAEVKEDPVDKKVEKAVIKAIGEKNNFKKPTIDSISYVETDRGAIIVLNANENVTANLTKKGIWLDSKKVFEEIKDIEEVDLFILHWHLPLVDTYGNEKDELVMAFDITKDDLQKINYDNFSIDNLPKIVSDYFEHTALSK